MNNVREALSWIIDIIQKHNIPFQIAGGLAAKAYGSTRKLWDIDIDISETDFCKIKNDVKPSITFGPSQFKNKSWDLFLMTLNYQGQEIDISGAYYTKIYNSKNNSWERIATDFSKVNNIEIYGLILPIIACEELIAYKKILSRPVDLLDVEYLERKFNLNQP